MQPPATWLHFSPLQLQTSNGGTNTPSAGSAGYMQARPPGIFSNSQPLLLLVPVDLLPPAPACADLLPPEPAPVAAAVAAAVVASAATSVQLLLSVRSRSQSALYVDPSPREGVLGSDTRMATNKLLTNSVLAVCTNAGCNCQNRSLRRLSTSKLPSITFNKSFDLFRT